MVKSSVAALILGMITYTGILLLIFIANAAISPVEGFHYLLPGAWKSDLYGVDNIDMSMALASLPAYTLFYGGLAWLIFRIRAL